LCRQGDECAQREERGKRDARYYSSFPGGFMFIERTLVSRLVRSEKLELAVRFS
jgi:hypothetical protein